MKTFITKVLTIAVMLLTTLCHCRADDITVTRCYDLSKMYFNEIETTEGGRATLIGMNMVPTAENLDFYELPHDCFNVYVPTYCNNIRITGLVCTDHERLTLNAPVLQCSMDSSLDNDSDSDYISTYDDSHVQTPECSACIIGEGFIMGDIHVVTVKITPFAYNPDEKKLISAKSVNINITYDLCEETEMIGQPLKSKHPDSSIKQFGIQEIQASLTGLRKSNSAQSFPIIPADEVVKYYIIVPESLSKSVERLAIWKAQKGYDVTVKTIESILSTPRYGIGQSFRFGGWTQTIVDEAVALRAFLHDEFEQYGPYFCFLVGDYRANMPIRRVKRFFHLKDYYKNPNGEAFLTTDNYFSDLTTLWKLDKPEGYDIYFRTYEKLNYYPDIFVGRLLCHTNEQVSNYVEKLIRYECNPGNGDASYLGKAFYFEQNQENPYNGCVGDADIIRAKFDPFGDSNTTVLWDACYPPKDTIAYKRPWHDIPHKGSDVVRLMSDAGFISMFGQGTPTNIGVCGHDYYIVSSSEYSKDELYISLKGDDMKCGINDMTNFNKPSIMYSTGCDNAPFDAFTFGGDIIPIDDFRTNILDNGHCFDMEYNMASAYTTSGLYGGVAFLATCRENWHYANIDMEVNFCESVLNCRRLGMAEAFAKINCTDPVTKYAHNLIGEPEFSMWMGEPLSYNYQSVISSAGIQLSNLPVRAKGFRYAFEKSTFTGPQIVSSGIWHGAKSNYDYVISFWEQDALPIICYIATYGYLVDNRHEAIVNKAYIGSGNSKNPFLFINSSLVLRVLGNTIFQDGVQIAKNSNVSVETDNNCSVGCLTVKDGSDFSIIADRLTLGTGFKVEKGSTFKYLKK